MQATSGWAAHDTNRNTCMIPDATIELPARPSAKSPQWSQAALDQFNELICQGLSTEQAHLSVLHTYQSHLPPARRPLRPDLLSDHSPSCAQPLVR